MTDSELALVSLAMASALHLGFQLTVTMVVYPALARVDEAGWGVAHGRHSRAITPIVVLVYGALLVTGAWAVSVVARGGDGGADLGGAPTLWVWVCLAGAVLAMLATAVVEAPLHGLLGRGRDQALVDRLLRGDRVRAVGAVVSVVGAVLALATAAG
jgi:hypothetical protein